MNIVFALTNPVPDVDPVEARKEGALVCTGRSNYSNQYNKPGGHYFLFGL